MSVWQYVQLYISILTFDSISSHTNGMLLTETNGSIFHLCFIVCKFQCSILLVFQSVMSVPLVLGEKLPNISPPVKSPQSKA